MSKEVEPYLAGDHVVLAVALVAEAIPKPHLQNHRVSARLWVLAASEVALGEASETAVASEGEVISATEDAEASVAASEVEEEASATSPTAASEHRMAHLLDLEAASAVEVGMVAIEVVGMAVAVAVMMTVDPGTLTTNLCRHEAVATVVGATAADTVTETLAASTVARSGRMRAAAVGTMSQDHADDTDELRPEPPGAAAISDGFGKAKRHRTCLSDSGRRSYSPIADAANTIEPLAIRHNLATSTNGEQANNGESDYLFKGKHRLSRDRGYRGACSTAHWHMRRGSVSFLLFCVVLLVLFWLFQLARWGEYVLVVIADSKVRVWMPASCSIFSCL